MDISKNIEQVQDKIKQAAEKANRNPEDIKLVAVTKTASIEQTKNAIEAGVRIIGENRLQVAQDKFPHLPEVEKHMIGHLQTNKVKEAVKLFDVIQSVDSLKLAKEIDKRSQEEGKIMPVMLQVNSAGEEQKFGVPLSEAKEFYTKIMTLPNVKVVGIMTMAPLVEPEETREYFKATKKIADELNIREISMGMTNDYIIAIEEGSTMVRVGRDIFNPA